MASGTSDVLGFEAAADWALDPSDSGVTTIVGINSGRTQGASSLEVTAQNWARFNSVPMSSMGSIGSMVLIDVQLPTVQANPSWYGDAQMFVSAPSLGINNVPLGDVGLTGLALGTWQTLAFQIPAANAATIAHGVYSDLTFSVVLNVPYNETGHYLLDNIRSIPDVVPSVLGIAQEGSTTKAIFDYVTTSSTAVNIPYGTGNGLSNSSGFIASPPQIPPTTFVSATHAPFVATLSGSLLTWKVGSHSAIATPGSQQLAVTPNGDGTHDATLPDGRKVNIDSVPPASPIAAAGPPVSPAPFNGTLNGQFAISPSGAATYTVPIAIPPGIAGMAPNLALSYSSQGNDGIAGQGWSLSGLSTIGRCPRTRQQDGYARPVMLDSITGPNPDGLTDGICLDGKKLLDAGNGNYIAEQTDFSQISLDSTGAFQVVTKSGETRYYGRCTSDGNCTNDRVGGSQTAIWLLDRVVDEWGNYFDLHYNNDLGNGLLPDQSTNFTKSGIWVSKIDYTGSTGNGSNPVSPFTSVTFQYECRPDIRWSRMASLKVPQSQRLKSITTAQGTYAITYSQPVAPVSGAACPVGSGPPTTLGVSEVQSIGYCAGSTCLEPLTFGWQGGGSGGWQSKPAYTLPSSVIAPGKGLKGTQFVDIDGDGRADFVLGRTKGNGGQPQLATVLNTGSGWGPQLAGPGKTFPLYLSDSSDNPTQVRFADLDGDGRPDLIVDSANVSCDSNGCVSCPVGQGCAGQQPYGPAVWLNRFTVGGGGGWQFDHTYSGTSMSFNNATMMGDVDGDQKTDIIQVLENVGTPATLFVQVFLNSTVQGVHSWPLRDESYTVPALNGAVRAVDVNRDGLVDLVQDQFFLYADGSVAASELDLINLGPGHPDPQHTFRAVFHAAPDGGSPIDPSISPPHYGDIDGDGFYDVSEFASLSRGSLGYLAAVGFGDGTGSGFGSDTNQQKYINVLKAYAPPVCGDFDLGCAAPEDYGFALADINGDGLVDLVRNHVNRTGGIQDNQGGGEVLLNNGQTWISVAGTNGWQIGAGQGKIPAVVPSEATVNAGSAFVDLDGDGITDIIQEEFDSIAPGAWLSTYQRPLIMSFPNGLAQPTTVSYVSTTSASNTYKDDDTTTEANIKPFAVPVTVVQSTLGEDGSGTGSKATKTYTYHSMRQDAFGRGPSGFHRVEMLDQASSVRTVTTYFQAYPYSGMPAEVDRYQVVGTQSYLTNKTTTLYCDSADANPVSPLGCGPVPAGQFPVGAKVFTFPSTVTDVAYLRPENGTADNTNIVTTFKYDGLGNTSDTLTQLVKTEGGATENFQKEIQSYYETAESTKEGKPTRTVTTATGGTKSTTHTTTFEYSPIDTFGGTSTRLALTKKHLEPGAGWPIQLDTAYHYDQFGNADVTTSCASDFGSCNATNPPTANPFGSGDPVHHPPFRTTTVSYDPAALGIPVPYLIGRFPTTTTNALGQTERTLYDPVLGKVLTKTGPNGIETCYTYDLLGRQTSEIDRCGSAAPLVTTTQHFLTLPALSICITPPNCPPPTTNFVAAELRGRHRDYAAHTDSRLELYG